VIAGGALTFASGLLAARWITDRSLPDGTRRRLQHANLSNARPGSL
jgi:hypothetical protein